MDSFDNETETTKSYTFDRAFVTNFKAIALDEGRNIAMSTTATNYLCNKFKGQSVTQGEIVAAIEEFVRPKISYAIGEAPKPKELDSNETKNFEAMVDFINRSCERAAGTQATHIAR